jgi:leucyl-tRNA synthetase
LSPFAPHLAEELYSELQSRFPHLPAGPVSELPYPDYDARYLVEDEIEIVFQVNGKVRDKARVPASAGEEQLKSIALANDRIKELVDGKQVRKVIIVPKRLVNVVVG